jgi:hypothetical protein
LGLIHLADVNEASPDPDYFDRAVQSHRSGPAALPDEPRRDVATDAHSLRIAEIDTAAYPICGSLDDHSDWPIEFACWLELMSAVEAVHGRAVPTARGVLPGDAP